MTRLRFGILGTGNIAHQFADGVAGAHRSVVSAVGSRSQGHADDFAKAFNIPVAHGAYDALLADDTVDAVYVSLPNSLHQSWTVRALEAGKHVLCEKPFAVDTAGAKQMFAAAEKRGLVLVEAFMYRSHPLTEAVLEEVRRGAIGPVRLIRTSFCYHTRCVAGNVRFSSDLAGGALMDVGCYCVDFSRLFAGSEPVGCGCTGHMHETGVDELVAGTLAFPDGVVASFVCGMNVQTENAALICGAEGFIEVPVPWKPPPRGARYVIDSMTPPHQDRAADLRTRPVDRPSRRVVEIDAPAPLYALEADDFAAAVLDGAPPRMSKSDTIGNMRVLDELRSQVGVG